jgi:hypothetical protein
MGVGKSDSIDNTFAASVAGSKIDEEDLIDIMMDDLSDLFCEDCFFSVGQLAFEDAELEVIPPVSHGSENFTKPFWVAYIVGNDVGIAHDILRKKKIDLIVNDHANSLCVENKCFPSDRDAYGHFSENSLNKLTRLMM